jgi:hypothetical protein
MSLAFALMAAIHGSTGSSATLTYGLKGTKPRRRQPGGGKILTAPRWRRKPSETLACDLKIAAAIVIPQGWPRAARDAVG